MPKATHADEPQYPPFDLREPYTAENNEAVDAARDLVHFDAWDTAIEEFVDAIVEPLKLEVDDPESRADITAQSTDELFTAYGEYYAGGCAGGHDPGEDFLDGIAELIAIRVLRRSAKEGHDDIVTRLIEVQASQDIPPTTATLDAFVLWACGVIRASAVSGRISSLWKADVIRALDRAMRERFATALCDAVFETFLQRK